MIVVPNLPTLTVTANETASTGTDSSTTTAPPANGVSTGEQALRVGVLTSECRSDCYWNWHHCDYDCDDRYYDSNQCGSPGGDYHRQSAAIWFNECGSYDHGYHQQWHCYANRDYSRNHHKWRLWNHRQHAVDWCQSHWYPDDRYFPTRSAWYQHLRTN